jgi:hypothetical protein
MSRQASATSLSPESVREGQRVYQDWLASDEYDSSILVRRIFEAVTAVDRDIAQQPDRPQQTLN